MLLSLSRMNVIDFACERGTQVNRLAGTEGAVFQSLMYTGIVSRAGLPASGIHNWKSTPGRLNAR